MVQNGWRGLAENHPEVIELSRLLQTLPLHPLDARLPDFRNPNGVARKSFDIATAHPDYTGVPTHGGSTDKRVIAEFLARPEEMRAEAQALRAAALRGDFTALSSPVDEEDDEAAANEGRLLIRRHVTRERDPRLRRRKIESVRRLGMPLACEACGFDFEETYGERGQGYIECHHVIPLHVTGLHSTRLSDLALLCANCHRIIHVRHHGSRRPSCGRFSQSEDIIGRSPGKISYAPEPRIKRQVRSVSRPSEAVRSFG